MHKKVRKAIIPAAVGVDIGCGMMACKTTLAANDLPDNLGPLRSAIERASTIAATRPITPPIATIATLLLTIIATVLPLDAPSAIRSPISLVRCDTE